MVEKLINMPKLLQINITSNWGSTGKIVEQIGLCAMAQGWDSYVAFGRYSNPSKSKTIKVGTKLDTYLHYGEQRIFDNEGLCSQNATKKLIKQIKEIKPDIVQLHNIHDHYLNYQLLFEYLNNTNIKVVWTFHDCWAMTGHCFHFVTAGCERWKTGCHDCPLRDSYPKTLLDRSKKNWELKRTLFSNNKNLTIAACSHWIAGFVKESFLEDKRVEVLHNGVDLKTFIPKQRTKSSKIKILAVSSVWYKEKGELDIYKLRKLLPLDDYEITMVGLSPEQNKKLPEGIVGIERTQNVQELVQLYADADVLINPTYHDTFPTVNLEALACGTPVITYRTGGSPEAIVEGDESVGVNEKMQICPTGIVVEQGNVEVLAEAIMWIKNHPIPLENCRKRAEQHFDKDKCFEKYIELYEELIRKE